MKLFYCKNGQFLTADQIKQQRCLKALQHEISPETKHENGIPYAEYPAEADNG